MKTSITLEFESPDHAIIALNAVRELRKGNFGETTTVATKPEADTGNSGDTSTPPVADTPPKARKPRKKKGDPAVTTPDTPAEAPADPPPAAVLSETAPSLADVQEAVKGIFATKGAVAALNLLQTYGVERAAELPEDKRAEFIEKAKAL